MLQQIGNHSDRLDRGNPRKILIKSIPSLISRVISSHQR